MPKTRKSLLPNLGRGTSENFPSPTGGVDGVINDQINHPDQVKSYQKYYDICKNELERTTGNELGDIRDDALKAYTGQLILGIGIITGGSGFALLPMIGITTGAGTGINLIATNFSKQTGIGQVDEYNKLCANGPAGFDKYDKVCTDNRFDQGKYMNSGLNSGLNGTDVSNTLCGDQDRNHDGTVDMNEISLLECVGNQAGILEGGYVIGKSADFVIGKINSLEVIPIKPGKLIGSIEKLTPDEKIAVNDLILKGKEVEIIPRNSEIKTPDFIINGIKTELKTLQNYRY